MFYERVMSFLGPHLRVGVMTLKHMLCFLKGPRAFKYMRLNQFTIALGKAAATIISLHTVHWVSELMYHQHCSSGFLRSLYTHGSLSCKALRTVSDTMSSSMGNALTAVAVVASLAIPTPRQLQHGADHV